MASAACRAAYLVAPPSGRFLDGGSPRLWPLGVYMGHACISAATKTAARRLQSPLSMPELLPLRAAPNHAVLSSSSATRLCCRPAARATHSRNCISARASRTLMWDSSNARMLNNVRKSAI